jgi:hypothetical protein
MLPVYFVRDVPVCTTPFANPHLPVFVSADFKGLSISVSCLESIFADVFASVDSKGFVSKHNSYLEFAIWGRLSHAIKRVPVSLRGRRRQQG